MPVAEGALVSRVFDESAAHEAGVLDGDVVMSVNGNVVLGASDLRNEVGLLRVGETATLEIVRDGDPMVIDAIIKARPDEPQLASLNTDEQQARTNDVEFMGALFGPIDPASEMSGRINGVQVIDVTPDSRAWMAGLRPGDVITEVARNKVTTPEQFADAVNNQDDGRVALHVRRGNQAFYVLI